MTKKDLLVSFPESLRALPQWVLWKFEKTDKGKITKIPYQTNGRKASSTRPTEWSTFKDCMSVLERFDGVGFVFVDGVIGIDLDHCINEDGVLETWAREVLNQFPSYTERSPSGKGLHIILQSDVTIDGKKKGLLECYSSGRFFTVTGDIFEGRDTLNDCDISTWYAETFGEKSVTAEIAQTVYLPDDATILGVMFRSKGGERIRTLYEAGTWQSLGYGSQSEADLSLVGSLMFYCQNDKSTVDRLFRKSRLMRPKWDEKHGIETYGAQTIKFAVRPEVMEWREMENESKTLDFLMSEGKNPYPLLVLENICRVFEADSTLKTRFRLNEFSHMVESRHRSGWINLQDNDILDVERYVSVNFNCFAKVSKEMITDAIKATACNNKVNPPRDYITGLVWDKKPRLDTWLHTVYGVPDDELHRAIGSNWMKGLVKRVIEPGYQFDEVLVLEGDQGYRKSMSLRALGSPWHVESTLSTEDKDFYLLLACNIIVEFSEGDIIGRTSARKLKAIITKTEDSVRAPYERGHQVFKRGCVFAMTTNDSDYQKDETGGRRWLPVVLEKPADVEWLKENRDQLYAEAVYRVMVLKETTHEYPQDALREIQSSKMEFDEISEPLQDWYSKLSDVERFEGVLTLDAYNAALNSKSDNQWTTVPDERQIPVAMMWRIGKIFRTVLGLKQKVFRTTEGLKKRWVKR